MVLLLSLLCLFTLASSEQNLPQNNDYPVVFVHGFAGWGRDELLTLKYWGGIEGDFQSRLNHDFNTKNFMTASVGPFSSNWDRACELYAQIKGGDINYGNKHAQQFNHKEKVAGSQPSGLYPEWGTKDPSTGQIRKVHFIGHSMGGQTIRMLTQMLNDPESHLEGGDWVASITTFSTPHKGTLLGDAAEVFRDIVATGIGGFIGFAHAFGGAVAKVYDAKMPQFDMQPKKHGESFLAYFKRLYHSALFRPGFSDISHYDLSLAGAKKQNEWCPELPHVYYYSYSNRDTFKGTYLHKLKFRQVQYPRIHTMLTPFVPFSTLIGGIFVTITKKLPHIWQVNDGVVNTYSMRGPDENNIVEWKKQSKPGRFHFMGELDACDHADVIGFSIFTGMYKIYKSHVAILRNLPIHQEGMTKRQLQEFSHPAHESLNTELQTAIDHVNSQAPLKHDKSKIEQMCKEAKDANIKLLCEYKYNDNKSLRRSR